MRKILKGKFVNSTYGELPLWQSVDAISGKVNGYSAYATNQVPSTFDVSKSGIVFGNFSDLIIAYWSGVDIIVDPYTLSTKGDVVITAFVSVDVALRHPESFAIITDITA